MPQLDVSTWPPQLIWLAITFLALYYIVTNMIIPRTGGVIRERKTTIDNDLAAAQRLKAETDQAARAYEAALAEARQKANAIAAENRDRITAEVDADRARLDAELADKITAAEKSIAGTKAKALSDIETVAGDIAGEIVAALTGSKASKADVAAAVAKAAGK
jgi:F-type H+-transporting ATPase subunit b